MPPLSIQAPDQSPRAAIRCKGALGTGKAVANTVPASEVLAIAGSARIRVRLVANVLGTLDLTYGEADPTTANFVAFTTGNPVSVAVSANVEALIESDTHGESFARITFTPGADGTITRCSLCQI